MQRAARRQSASRMGHTQVSMLQTTITLTDKFAIRGGSPLVSSTTLLTEFRSTGSMKPTSGGQGL